MQFIYNLHTDYKKLCKSTYIGNSWTNYSCNSKSTKKKSKYKLPVSTYSQKMLKFVFSKITVHWDVRSSSLMDGHQHFGKMTCINLQFCFNSECGGNHFLQNVQSYLTKLNSATSHNTSVTIITVRTSTVSLLSFVN
jgi:hypothetical protein